ncbi:hypothetical protein [Novosphingobium sp. Gsoil 351]|uniref:hypothetical protein n=1 Tax=Novosphingobium sp. Gsoil 351 TaxID=2675225 RepID=UPI0012B50300|nr:hypothetical protein [Novosphingobium sp. Gsoil 351]QGN53872.1 hypothetical protein GKE62_04330 [Novosphingobium sp. Gsoil 351]
MARILMVGIDPDLVDFSDPALPPGVTVEVIRSGIVSGLADLRNAGHDADQLYIPPDPLALDGLRAKLAEQPVDCVIIGGGVRIPPRNLALFEAVLNAIGSATPTPAIALVSRPDEALQAVGRALR